MKAIILAGGVVCRLLPMTCDCPKPMAPMMNRPVMEYALRLLKKHGVDEIAATVCYLPDNIRDHFGDGSRFGVKMHYYRETEPLGTAGGVKMAQDFLDETFFVLSGDGLTDCDLTDALRFHREKGAKATIVLKETPAPTEYGVAVLEEDGRIRNFLEKPDWSDVLSDTVNTGIYILEPEVLSLVPEGVQADFSRDLFPELMRTGAGVYGYTMQGYWCDVGDVESYLGAHRAFLRGDIALEGGGSYVDESARVDGRARIEEPCFIGPGAVVERDAFIGAGSVIGTGAHIGRAAVVKRSVLWPGARLEERAQASGCVLCDGAVLGAGSRAYEGAVLGARSRLGMDAVLMPGARVWPHKHIAECSKVAQDIVWGSSAAAHFRNGRLTLQDSAQALRLGQVFAGEKPNEGVLLGCDGTAGGFCMMRAAEAGLLGAGAHVTVARGVQLPVFRLLCRLLHADRALYCMQGRMLPLTGAGAELPREKIRRIEKAFAQESMPVSFADSAPASGSFAGAQGLYLGDIALHFAADVPCGLRRAPAVVFASQEDMLALAEKAFARAGRVCRAEYDEELMELRQGETGFWLNADGCLVRAAQGDAAVDGAMLRMLLLWTALEAGERKVALAGGESEAAAALCARYGAKIERMHSGEGDEQSTLAGVSPLLLRLRTDGVFAACSALAALEAKNYTLADWQAELPRMAYLTRVLPVEQAAKGRVLRAFAHEFPQAELGDGVRIRSQQGRIWVRPSSDSAECMLSCEAADMPTAQSLLAEYTEKLMRAAHGRN